MHLDRRTTPVELQDRLSQVENATDLRKDRLISTHGGSRMIGVDTPLRNDLQVHQQVGPALHYNYIDTYPVFPQQIQLNHSALMEVDHLGSSAKEHTREVMLRSTPLDYSSNAFSTCYVGTASVVSGTIQPNTQQLIQIKSVNPEVSSTLLQVPLRTSLWFNGYNTFKNVPDKLNNKTFPKLEKLEYSTPSDFNLFAGNPYQDNRESTQIPHYQIHYYQQQNQVSVNNTPCSIYNCINPDAIELYFSANNSEEPDKPHLHQVPAQASIRDWFDQSLSLAREKYKDESFTEAYQILHTLHQLDPTNVPTLLLLGCTCYSLSLYQLSIHYNTLILQMNPSFVEALSNLGTTHRAVAQNEQMNFQNSSSECYSLNSLYHLSLAEKCYRSAIAIRPKYWDANINLSVLLSISGRNREAIEVNNNLENLLESDLNYNERLDIILSRLENEHSSEPNTLNVVHGSSDLAFDKKSIALICSIERNRIARSERVLPSEVVSSAVNSGFTAERRRDFYYAKGRLYYALGDLKLAKLEYHKGLAVIGVDLEALYRNCWDIPLPQRLLTTQQALAALQSHQQNAQRQGKDISYGKPPSIQEFQNTYTSCPAILLPSIRNKPLPLSVYSTSTSSILQTLAKIYQDSNQPNMAVTLYYYSLGIYPTANACNNIGILIAQQRLDESISWYSFGLPLDPNHVHLLTNIGSALKDKGQVNEGIMYYQKAISVRPDFYIVLVNLANVYKGLGKINEAIALYKKSLKIMPNFIEAFCNYVNILLFICDWTQRDENLEKSKQILYKQLTEKVNNGLRQPPTILPFHTFTYPGLEPWMVREISHRNAQKVVWNVVTGPWFPGFPERPKIALLRILTELVRLYRVRETKVVETFTQEQNGQNNILQDSPQLNNPNLIDIIFKFSMEMIAVKSNSIIVKLDRSHNIRNIILRFLSILSEADPLLHDAVVRLLRYPFPYELPSPPNPIMNIGYVSSDFNNHPLAHLMQSVYGMHDKTRYRVFCYALSPTDVSQYREKIQLEADVFIDVSLWSIDEILNRIVNVDKIHILCNLNGYTKGARNEIFAARPAPVQMQFMGFAGTMGGGESYDPEKLQVYLDKRYEEQPESRNYIDRYRIKDNFNEQEEEIYNHYSGIQGCFIDYLVTDQISCPRKFVCNEPLSEKEVTLEPEGDPVIVNRGLVRNEDDANRVYTESLIYLPHSYFVNDHLQSFREPYQEDIETIIFGDSNSHSNNHDEYEDDPELDDNLTVEEKILWTREQIRRVKARARIFPMLGKDVVIYANFNQLYKIDPQIFSCWIDILRAVPNSVLWLLRFPAPGEPQLKKRALELGGEDVAQRIIFTDVAPKHVHVYRGRVVDVFLDTPECNAHTTAADIMWSGTPVVTYPKYDFKMCSRVCSSIAAAAGSWKVSDYEKIDGNEKAVMEAKAGMRAYGVKSLENKHLLAHWMITKSYEEYKKVAINFGLTMKWEWKKIFKAIPKQTSDSFITPRVNGSHFSKSDTKVSKYVCNESCRSMLSCFYPSLSNPTHIYCVSTSCLAGRLRMRLFLSRETCDLFNTRKSVRSIEVAYDKAYAKFRKEWEIMIKKNEEDLLNSLISWAINIVCEGDNNTNYSSAFKPEIGRGLFIDNYSSYIIKMPPYMPLDSSYRRKTTRCIRIHEEEVLRS